MNKKYVDNITETEYTLEIDLEYDDEGKYDEDHVEDAAAIILERFKGHQKEFKTLQEYLDHVEIKNASAGEIYSICKCVEKLRREGK